MGNVQDYIKNYNKEHYKTINAKVSPELFAKIDDFKKKNNLSIPKLLSAGLNALEENEKLREANEGMYKRGAEILEELKVKRQEVLNLKQEIEELKKRSFFDYLFTGLKSEGAKNKISGSSVE